MRIGSGCGNNNNNNSVDLLKFLITPKGQLQASTEERKMH
jgi:hypothetical protein